MDEIINEETPKPPQYYADFDEAGNITAFYVDEIHGDSIPETAIPITFDEWQTFLQDASKWKLDSDTIREKTQEELAEEEANRPPSPKSDIEFLGEQLVEKEIQIMSLQNDNEFLGQQVVDLEIRLMQGGL